MKLVRYGEAGQERPGIWLDGEEPRIVDVRGMAFDITDYDARFGAPGGVARLRGLLDDPGLKTVPAAGVRLGVPVARPRMVVCLGKNFAEHAAEFDGQRAECPVYFAKATGALAGPGDAIRVPAGAEMDGEVELALVVGRRARRVKAAEAMECVAGWMVFNDVTRRDEQRRRGQWFFAKGGDGCGPCGPWLTTADEAGDVYAKTMRQRVNGRVLQEARAGEMIFRVAEVLEDLTAWMTLEAGDVVSLGTPGGIGSARTPPVLLKAGDVVECEIEGLGTLRNPVAAEEDAP